MKTASLSVALAAALSLSGIAFAQEAAPAETAAPQAAAATPDIKRGSLVRSSDGKRIGRIEKIMKDKSGSPTSVSIITSSRFVYVPVTTLSGADGDLVTSMTRAEVLGTR